MREMLRFVIANIWKLIALFHGAEVRKIQIISIFIVAKTTLMIGVVSLSGLKILRCERRIFHITKIGLIKLFLIKYCFRFYWPTSYLV